MRRSAGTLVGGGEAPAQVGPATVEKSCCREPSLSPEILRHPGRVLRLWMATTRLSVLSLRKERRSEYWCAFSTARTSHLRALSIGVTPMVYGKSLSSSRLDGLSTTVSKSP